MRHTNLLLIYMIYPPGRCNMHTLESSVGMITDGIFCRRFDSGKVYSNSHGNEYGIVGNFTRIVMVMRVRQSQIICIHTVYLLQIWFPSLQHFSIEAKQTKQGMYLKCHNSNHTHDIHVSINMINSSTQKHVGGCYKPYGGCGCYMRPLTFLIWRIELAAWERSPKQVKIDFSFLKIQMSHNWHGRGLVRCNCKVQSLVCVFYTE